MKNTKDNIKLTDSIYNSPVTADEIRASSKNTQHY